jgi:hypothetical protein
MKISHSIQVSFFDIVSVSFMTHIRIIIQIHTFVNFKLPLYSLLCLIKQCEVDSSVR